MLVRFPYRRQIEAVAGVRARRQGGYVLLVLLLMISMLAIAAIVAVTPIRFQIERDREEEMIHRGVQYSRAIRKYFKKFGRYPTKLEDLDSSNNTRFLRKHYKDPVNKNQDFKLLHYGDPGVRMGTAGLPINGATGLNQNIAAGQTGGPAFSNQAGPQFGAQGLAGGNPSTQFGPQQNTPPSTDPNQSDANSGGAYAGNSASTTPQGDSANGTSSTSSSSSSSSSSSNGFGGPTFGGGPIVGVVSSSKNDAIREFNHKKKYNEWQFIYDPSSDRGGLMMTPNQPPLQGAVNLNGQPANGQNLNGQPNQSSTTGTQSQDYNAPQNNAPPQGPNPQQ